MRRCLYNITGCVIKVHQALDLKYSMMPGKQNKYTVQFKLAVITFAENSNNSATRQEYGVDEKLVWNCKKDKYYIIGNAKKSVLTEAKSQNI